MMYDKIFDNLQEKVNNGQLTIEQAEEVNTLAYEKYIEEGIKDTVTNKLGKVMDKAKANSDLYVAGINKRGEEIAKKVIRKPKMDSPHAVEKYQAKINSVKNAYKVGEIIATNLAVLAIPLPGSSTIYNLGILAPALGRSNDPTDKPIKDAIEKIATKGNAFKAKVTNFVNSIKGKKVTSEIDASIKKLESEGLNIAKEFDSVIQRANANNNPVTESVSFDVITEKVNSCVSLDEKINLINSFILNTEYTEGTFAFVESLINSL